MIKIKPFVSFWLITFVSNARVYSFTRGLADTLEEVPYYEISFVILSSGVAKI